MVGVEGERLDTLEENNEEESSVRSQPNPNNAAKPAASQFASQQQTDFILALKKDVDAIQIWAQNLNVKIDEVLAGTAGQAHSYSSNNKTLSKTLRKTQSEDDDKKSLMSPLKRLIRKDTEEIFTITEKWKYEAHNDSITDVKFVKDDGAVFIISTSIDKTALVYNFTTRQPVFKYKGHKGAVNSIKMHSSLALTASGDRSAHIWRFGDININSGDISPVKDFSQAQILNTPVYATKHLDTGILTCAEWFQDANDSQGQTELKFITGSSDGCIRQYDGGSSQPNPLWTSDNMNEKILKLILDPSNASVFYSMTSSKLSRIDTRAPKYEVNTICTLSEKQVFLDANLKNSEIYYSSSDRSLRKVDVHAPNTAITCRKLAKNIQKFAYVPQMDTFCFMFINKIKLYDSKEYKGSFSEGSHMITAFDYMLKKDKLFIASSNKSGFIKVHQVEQ